MEHLSEVVKILDAALTHDLEKATSYANLLASKLEDDRQPRQARAVRSVLAKLPAKTVKAASAELQIPRDSDSEFSIVDFVPVSELNPPNLVLHRYVEQRMADFLDSVAMFDQLEARGIRPTNRLLIFGPPGTGKTSLAHYIAHNLKLPLVLTRSDTLVSSLLGQTSRNIRKIFEYANSTPCVLFLDEFDALGKNRKDTREIGELQRVVIALLQNIDALSSSTILIAATNHEELLDPAVWRRFEYTIKVAVPTKSERASMWSNYLHDLHISDGTIDALSQYSEGLAGAAIYVAANDIRRVSLRNDDQSPSLPMMLQRLARILWFDNHERFETPAAEMASLRSWAPAVFTVRALQDLFHVSTRQVTKAVKV